MVPRHVQHKTTVPTKTGQFAASGRVPHAHGIVLPCGIPRPARDAPVVWAPGHTTHSGRVAAEAGDFCSILGISNPDCLVLRPSDNPSPVTVPRQAMHQRLMSTKSERLLPDGNVPDGGRSRRRAL